MSSIPISQVVTINPAVIGTGGNPLALNGVFVSSNDDIPVQSEQVFAFASADDVATYFGDDSTEAELASNYFLGFDNSQKKPQSMIFTPYLKVDRGAWLRGTSLRGMLLSEAQEISGAISLKINSTAYSVSSIDLSSATSFTDIASQLQTLLNIPTATSVISWDATFACFRIKNVSTGTDSTISDVTGAAAVSLGIAGGTISNGASSDTPTTAMNRIKANSLNWGSFTYIEDEVADEKEGFAKWVNNQSKRYLLVAWDDDPLAKVTDSTCFGNTVAEEKYEGVMCVYDSANIAAFVMGAFASVDWDATNGRITSAFKSQSGLETSCTTLSDATALLANGYSYYGGYAASGEDNTYNFLYDGQMCGSDYKFADSYVNQIFLNSQLQLSIIELLTSARSIPYNERGYSLLRLACLDPINQALNNGTIQTGVSVSDNQKAQIISALGFDVSTELTANGYYLYIGDATAQVRGERQSPPMSLYYMDGGSIQKVELGSIVIL